MRVGLVCPYTFDVPGGVQAHVRDLADALLRRGHEVSVLAPADDETPLPPHVEAAGRAVPVPYNGSVARLLFGPRSAARVRRWIREGGFDVLHIHEPMSPSLSLLACWAADGPIVGTFHAATQRSRAMTAAYGILQPALEKISARIAVSEDARDTLVRHLGGDAVLIPNGVSLQAYETDLPPGGAADLSPGRAADVASIDGRTGPTLGFLGRVDEPRKGLAVLLRAFTELSHRRPEVKLLIAGPGDFGSLVGDVPVDVQGRIRYLGAVSEADKPRTYRSADVFVAPNTGGESFGIVLLEAMAAGVPVLASDIDAFRAVLEDGRAGALFRASDPADLARAAAELLDDPVRRRDLATAARGVAARYDWDIVVRDVLAVYETVVHPGAPVRSRD